MSPTDSQIPLGSAFAASGEGYRRTSGLKRWERARFEEALWSSSELSFAANLTAQSQLVAVKGHHSYLMGQNLAELTLISARKGP